MAVPLYSYDLAYRGLVPERRLLKLERDGLAKVVRKRTGRIARAVMYRRPDEPAQTVLRGSMGAGYSVKHHLGDGHRPKRGVVGGKEIEKLRMREGKSHTGRFATLGLDARP